MHHHQHTHMSTIQTLSHSFSCYSLAVADGLFRASLLAPAVHMTERRARHVRRILKGGGAKQQFASKRGVNIISISKWLCLFMVSSMKLSWRGGMKLICYSTFIISLISDIICLLSRLIMTRTDKRCVPHVERRSTLERNQ